MNNDIKIGWVTVLTLAVLALAMFFTSIARSDVPTMEARIRAVAPAFASKYGPPVDFSELARTVANVAKGDRQGAAILLTIAIHESGLRESIRLDQYGPQQGDAYRDRDGTIRHRASGLWQVHKNHHNAHVWGSHDMGDQARMAARLAAGALARCRKLAPYPINVFRGYAGRACDAPLKGEEERAKTFKLVLRRL